MNRRAGSTTRVFVCGPAVAVMAACAPHAAVQSSTGGDDVVIGEDDVVIGGDGVVIGGRGGVVVGPGEVISGSGGSSTVSCTGGQCSLSFSGSGASARVLGTTFAFEGVRDGRATVVVDDTRVSCTQGETVPVRGVELRCTRVAGDSVTVTVTRR